MDWSHHSCKSTTMVDIKAQGDTLENPLPTVTAWDHNSVVTANLIQMNNHCDGRDLRDPIPTITAGMVTSEK